MSLSFQVVAKLESQNEILKICRNDKSVFLFFCLSVFIRNARKVNILRHSVRMKVVCFCQVEQPKAFQFPFVFSRYGRNMNHKSFSCLFFHENLRGIVRCRKFRKSANSVVTDSSSRVTKRTVRQRFYPKLQNCLFIPAMTPNDRGYGHLAVCGSIRCRETTK